MDLYDHSVLKASENIVSAILLDSVKRGASDIHIEPEFLNLKVRYRVHGVMHDVLEIPSSFASSVIQDVKEKAGMSVSSAALPREGKIQFNLKGEAYRFSVSLVPVLYGERAVLHRIDYRLLSRELSELGLESSDIGAVNSILAERKGLLIITGKLGDGRTTTALNLLQREIRSGRSCISFESAQSYEIAEMSQHGISNSGGLLKIFNEDLIGEHEMVLIDEAISSIIMKRAVELSSRKMVVALTRAPDLSAALFNTIDMGVEPEALLSRLSGIFSQRMVKELCSSCREGYQQEQCPGASADISVDTAADEAACLISGKIYRNRGCELCYGTGYSGQRLLGDLCTAGEEMRNLIMNSRDRQFRRMEKKRRSDDYLHRYSALCNEGVTTVMEIARILELPHSKPRCS
ncbi:MAG: ATPase, T2SS/T4P/T4SS family [Vulcanimicrobiota bacterium]